MAVYLISYDLNTPGKDYDDLIPAIKTLGDTYHVLKSQFLVSTSRKASELNSFVQSFIDNNDDVFITKLDSDWAAYINNAEALKSWITARI